MWCCRKHHSQACRRPLGLLQSPVGGLEQEDRWALGEAIPAKPSQGGFRARPFSLGERGAEFLSSLDSGKRWCEWIDSEKGWG